MKYYFLTLALLLPLLSSCQNNEPTSTPHTSTQYLPAIQAPFSAPNDSIKGLDGNSIQLSNYRGKPIIINFWATWCPPCRKELPSMNRAWKILKKEGIEMLAINMSESAVSIKKFTENHPIDFKILLDETGHYSKQWKVTGLPTTFVIDNHGKAVYKVVGGREWDNPEILKSIKDLATQ